MEYICVKWIHSHPDEPVWLYIELNDERWEVRKVEVFLDGRVGWADTSNEVGGTGLGLETVPPLKEIAEQIEFEPRTIPKDEFEQVWKKALNSTAEQA